MNHNYRFIHLLYVPTMACNMACKYCYLDDNTKDISSEYTALETLEYAVEKFMNNNVIPFNISLHGGEVTTLSKKDFHDIIEYINNYYKKNKMLIESNGFNVGNPHIKTNLYDLEKHIDTIKEFNVSISGSLDLPLDIHDKYRLTKDNRKTKDIILHNISLLKDIPNKKKVSATIFKEHFNLKKIAEDIKFLEKNTCLDMNDFNFMIGFDYNSNNILHHISEEEQLELYNYMKKEFTNTSLEQGLKTSWFTEFGPSFCTNCNNCGEKFFLLEKNGDIYSCVRGQKNKDYYYGNIYDNSIEEILDKAFKMIKKAHNKLPFNEECANCKYLYLCKTGCPFVKNTYGINKSYTCKLQKELYKDWGYNEDKYSEESLYSYLSIMHTDLLDKYYPSNNNEYRELKELIREDKKLKYIYDDNSYIISIDGEEYKLNSQILNRIRDIVYIGKDSTVILYVRKNIINEESIYPENNSIYIMLLSGNLIKYGDEQRTKQAHVMTHQIYKNVLEKSECEKEDFYKINLTNILKEYYDCLSVDKPNSLFVTTADLRDYHYQKQKNNAYYHIDSINLPFQNIEFYLLGGVEDDKD